MEDLRDAIIDQLTDPEQIDQQIEFLHEMGLHDFAEFGRVFVSLRGLYADQDTAQQRVNDLRSQIVESPKHDAKLHKHMDDALENLTRATTYVSAAEHKMLARLRASFTNELRRDFEEQDDEDQA